MGWKSSIPEMVPDRSQNHLFSFSFFLPQNFSANRYLHKNRSIIHQRFETCNDYIKPAIKKLFPLVHVQEMAIPLLCHKTSDYPIAKNRTGQRFIPPPVRLFTHYFISSDTD